MISSAVIDLPNTPMCHACIFLVRLSSTLAMLSHRRIPVAALVLALLAASASANPFSTIVNTQTNVASGYYLGNPGGGQNEIDSMGWMTANPYHDVTISVSLCAYIGSVCVAEELVIV